MSDTTAQAAAQDPTDIVAAALAAGNDEGTSNTAPVVDEVKLSPAWDEVLAIIPDSLAEMLRPKFKAFDAGVTKKLEETRAEYAPLEALKEFQIYDPQELQAGVVIMQRLQENPEEVVKALQEAYGLSRAEAQQAVAEVVAPATTEDDEFKDPRVDALTEQLAQLAAIIEQDQTTKQQAEQTDTITKYMTSLHERFDKNGFFDENYVLALMSQKVSGEVAVQQYQAQLAEAVKAQTAAITPPPAPVVMGGSGGSAPLALDKPVSELNSSQTKTLVADLLAAAAKQAE